MMLPMKRKVKMSVLVITKRGDGLRNEKPLEKSHTNEKTVVCLLEIDRTRGVIDFRKNLINTWQGMHDDGLCFHFVGEFSINLIAAFEFLIVIQVFEAFFLNAGLVENVDRTFESVEIFGFSEIHVAFGEVLFDIVTHFESSRRDKIYCDIRIISQEIGE